MEEKILEATRGVEFDDTKYSPHKYLVADDDRGYKVGDVVNVGTASKVYGPYRLTHQIVAGNGKVRFLAIKDGESIRQKALSKDELQQQNAQLLARLAALESAATKAMDGQSLNAQKPMETTKTNK